MVIKVTTADYTTVFDGMCGTDPQKGMYFQKSQKGNDSAPVTREKLYQPMTTTKTFFKKGVKHVVPHTYMKRIPWPKARRMHTEPHDYEMEMLSFMNPSIEWKRKVDIDFSSGTVHSCFGPPTFDTLEFDSNFINKQSKKLADLILGSDFNLGVTVGEGHKSLNMIGGAARRIAGGLNAAKRLDPKGLAKALGVRPGRYNSRNHGLTATSLWLEYRYGWTPLLLDVYNGAQVIANILNAPATKSFIVRGGRQGHAPPDTELPWGFDKLECTRTYQLIGLVTESQSTAVQLGLQDSLSVAWELLPYSFVVDWFLPIGTYLEARNAVSTLDAKYVETIVYTRRSEGLIDGFYQFNGTGSEYRFHSVRMDRKVRNDIPVALPNLRPLKDALGWKNCISALALLNNFAGRKN